MNLVLFCIYSAVTLLSIIFLALREFHMLQLNGYKTPEHSWWMRKNYKRYIFPFFLYIAQFVLLWTDVSVLTAAAFSLLNLSIAISNKPGKKFKKPFVLTARVKRMLTTFFIIIAAVFGLAIAVGMQRCKCGDLEPFLFNAPLSFILVGSALYLTPILVPLANLINKPIEKAIQNWYINDARKKLASMPSLHKVGITGSYGKTSMKFYLSELLNSQYETLKTPESFNTPMGVTITVRRDLKPTHEYFICEMGARRVHEIKELCGIADPHDGIITSVGPQHLETFGSIKNVLNTKFELADAVSPLGKLYLNGDNDLIR